MKLLEGVTVVDFTQAYSGPFCTMQLADFGATVIKIEKPGEGDQSREWLPLRNGHSGYYAAINRGKKSLALDISVPEGAEIAKNLIAKADIVVENFRPGTMKKFGLDYEAVSKENPKLVYASISGFGQNAPLRNLPAYDNIIQAFTGLQDMTGFPDSMPNRIGPSIGDSFTGLTCALGIMLAYFHVLRNGEGQYLDIAMSDAVFGILESPILFQSLLKTESVRCGNNDAETLVPYDVYACADGYFSAGLASDAGWDRFCRAIQMPELEHDPRFETNELRCGNYAEITPIIASFFKDKTRAELQKIFSAENIPNAPVLTIPEVMSHEQLKARGMLVSLEDEGIGTYTAVGNPVSLSETPAEIRAGAPLLGQHTDAVLREFGYSEEETGSLKKRGIIG